MSSIDEIKARINIVDLVSETVQLRRTGKNYTGFCPFHSNTRTPAFVVFADTGTWRCFGQCNEGGDIFRYVMKKEGWDFNEALKYLAERAGIQLRPPTPQEQEAAEEHDDGEAAQELGGPRAEEAVGRQHGDLLREGYAKLALQIGQVAHDGAIRPGELDRPDHLAVRRRERSEPRARFHICVSDRKLHHSLSR